MKRQHLGHPSREGRKTGVKPVWAIEGRVGRPSKGFDGVSQQTDDSMLAPSETNSSEDGPVIGRRGYKGSKGKGKGKGKSALRPKTTLLSMKGAKGYSDDPFDDNDDNDELAIREIQDNSPSVLGGPVSSSKRKLALLGASSSSNNINNDIDYPNKRPASRDSITPNTYDADINNTNTPKISLPLKMRDPNTPSRSANESLLVPPLITTPIPRSGTKWTRRVLELYFRWVHASHVRRKCGSWAATHTGALQRTCGREAGADRACDA